MVISIYPTSVTIVKYVLYKFKTNERKGYYNLKIKYKTFEIVTIGYIFILYVIYKSNM